MKKVEVSFVCSLSPYHKLFTQELLSVALNTIILNEYLYNYLLSFSSDKTVCSMNTVFGSHLA